MNPEWAARAQTDMVTAARASVQKVVVVNGNTDALGILGAVLDAGRYDMVFVESGDRAYSRIRAVRPDLVILCTRVDTLHGIELLTMLKMDEHTRDIPVLTHTTESDGQDLDDAISQLAEDEQDAQDAISARHAPRMN